MGRFVWDLKILLGAKGGARVAAGGGGGAGREHVRLTLTGGNAGLPPQGASLCCPLGLRDTLAGNEGRRVHFPGPARALLCRLGVC